jgi:antitoxin YefM
MTRSAVLSLGDVKSHLERLEESLEIMRDAAMMNRLAESDAELARGEFVSAEELAEVMRQRRAQ